MNARGLFGPPLLIIVFPAIWTFAQTNVNKEQGFKPHDSWHGGDLDSVSMTNGGLTLRIPLASLPQHGNHFLVTSLRPIDARR